VAVLVSAGCGEDPIVIFRVSSSTAGATAGIQVCEAGMTCTGVIADVLTESQREADGALFDAPGGLVDIPVQVTQGGIATAGCKRRLVPITRTPVELTITVGGATPIIECPSDVTCEAMTGCCTNFGTCEP
jgi:hypothetical protein